MDGVPTTAVNVPEETVPPPPLEPLDADVILPLASTTIFALLYVPALTPEVSSSQVEPEFDTTISPLSPSLIPPPPEAVTVTIPA